MQGINLEYINSLQKVFSNLDLQKNHLRNIKKNPESQTPFRRFRRSRVDPGNVFRIFIFFFNQVTLVILMLPVKN